MPAKCAICHRVKGKRKCKIRDEHLVCPLCCGGNRGGRCEGCQYYEQRNRFQRIKNTASGQKEFTIEFKEEVDEAMVEKSLRENNGTDLDAFINAQDEFDRAFSSMEKGDWKNAIKGFERSIRWHSTLPQPYGNMGLCYAKMGHKQAALAAFEKALEIDPNYEPAILNKAATEKLNEGQCLSLDLKVTRYYGTRGT